MNPPTPDDCVLHDHHLADLARSGLLPEHARAVGIQSLSTAGVSKIARFSVASTGYAIPYFGSDLVRLRLDTPPILDGNPSKYLSPKGAVNHLYILPDVLQNSNL